MNTILKHNREQWIKQLFISETLSATFKHKQGHFCWPLWHWKRSVAEVLRVKRRTLASASWPLIEQEELALFFLSKIMDFCTHWLNWRIQKKVQNEMEAGRSTERAREKWRKCQLWRSGQIRFTDKRIVVDVICECRSLVTSQRDQDVCHWVIYKLEQGGGGIAGSRFSLVGGWQGSTLRNKSQIGHLSLTDDVHDMWINCESYELCVIYIFHLLPSTTTTIKLPFYHTERESSMCAERPLYLLLYLLSH